MWPYCGWPGRSSTGPNDAIPTAAGASAAAKNATTSASVASGSAPVGMRVRATMSSGEEPSRQTNLVPPASTAPKRAGATSVMARTVPEVHPRGDAAKAAIGALSALKAAFATSGRSGDDDPEAVPDDGRRREQAHARDRGAGARADGRSAVVRPSGRDVGPGRQPDQGEGDEGDDRDADGERDDADDEQGSPGDAHGHSSQAAADAGTGAGTSLTLSALMGRRRDAA